MIANLLKMIYVNTKVWCKPRNTIEFNQTVKTLKTLNFRYDTETLLCQSYTTKYIKKRPNLHLLKSF